MFLLRNSRVPYALVTPTLRPALLEERAAHDLSISCFAWGYAAKEFENVDPRHDGHVVAIGYFRTLWLACRHPPKVLEVPEPLWLKKWPATFIFAWLVRISGRLQGLSLCIATYGIENLPLAEGLTTRRISHRIGSKLQHLDRFAAAILDWSASRTFDHIIYGTDAAQRNYESALPRLCERVPATMVESSFGRCIRCFPGRDEIVSCEPEILFLGEFCDRKGIGLLMDAWQQLDERPDRWRLTLIGHGELQEEVEKWAAVARGVHVEVDRSRTQIHAALRRSAVVVLPSCSVPGWKEQIGLPILEGLSHGCRIVTTSETGLASALVKAGHIVIADASPDSLKEALLWSMTEGLDTKKIPDPGAETNRMALMRILLGLKEEAQ